MDMPGTESQSSGGSLQDLLNDIKSKVGELESRIAQEETPQGEADEHGGKPEDYAAIMEDQGAVDGGAAEEEDEAIEAVPYKKKPAGNVMSFINGKK